jgi:hypothetical protein
MKTFQKWMLAVVLLAGWTTRAHAAEIFQNDDLTLNAGGRFQELGQLEYVQDDPTRDAARVYLFNVEDRLILSGDFKGFKFNFEEALGGEDISSSNNNLGLLEYSVDVPLIPDMAYIKVGQFKVPTNLESADYEGNLLFTDHSDLMNLFFNQGYDNGLSLWGHMGQLDFAGGVESGAPDLPQRYLPEIFQFPPELFLRIGLNDGINDDPFHPKETGFDKVTKSEFALHVNGQYENDSNAGHSDDLALEGGYLSTFSSNGPFGNALLSTLFNPFLGANGVFPVNDQYWDASIDFQYRAPMGDTVFTLQGEAIVAQYTSQLPVENGVQAYVNELMPGSETINGVLQPGGSINKMSSEALNIGGAELMASVGDNPWILATRLAMVVPDDGMVSATTYTYTAAGKTYAFGEGLASTPIFEITLPSITWKLNADTKIVAEAQWLINEPEATSNAHATPGANNYSASGDGTYLLTQMPSQMGGANVSTSSSIIPVGNMEFQFSF